MKQDHLEVSKLGVMNRGYR